jgi:phosphoribosylaminoimidazole carboxylase PurE protein
MSAITTIDKAIIEVRTGSDSDFPKIKEVLESLERENVAHALRILSAHRTPHEMMRAAAELGVENEVKVCIAAAGGSAHIAGMTASETSIPVIGLPVTDSATSGLTALLSMIQMPPGIPNGVVGIGQNTAAAQFAHRIARFGDNTDAKNWIREKKLSVFSNGINFDGETLGELGLNIVKDERAPIGIYFLNVDEEVPEDLKLPFKIPIIVPVSSSPLYQIGTGANNNILIKLDSFNQGLLMPLSVHEQGSSKLDKMINASLFAAQIYGTQDDKIREAFNDYRSSNAELVREKERYLQQVRAEGGRGF